ncbi:MAG: MFS transporter [Reyranella sp.]|nr:MFS transporter [Reyranella sp.]
MMAPDRRLVAAVCAALLLNMVGFANIGVVLPAAAADLGLNAAQAGLLGGVFFAAYAAGVPLFVPLTDRVSPLKVYAIGSAFWVAGGLCVALAEGGLALPLAGRALFGLGMAATYMPGLMLLVTRLPEQRRSAAASTYTSCIALGTGFCFAITGLVALYLPWRAAFAAAAAAAALALPIVMMAVRATPRLIELPRIAPPEVVTREPVALGRAGPALGFLIRPKLLGLLAASAGNAWEGMALRTWWIAYLIFCSQTPPDGSTLAKLAIATALAGLVAMPVSVVVARRAQGQRRVPILVAVCLASGLFSLLPPLFAGLPVPLMIGLTTVYLCLVFADAGTLPAAILEETPPPRRGTALAAAATASNAGAFVGAVTVGVVLDIAGGPASQIAWLFAFATMGAGSVVGGLVLWAAARPATQAR